MNCSIDAETARSRMKKGCKVADTPCLLGQKAQLSPHQYLSPEAYASCRVQDVKILGLTQQSLVELVTLS